MNTMNQLILRILGPSKADPFETMMSRIWSMLYLGFSIGIFTMMLLEISHAPRLFKLLLLFVAMAGFMRANR